MTRLDPIRVVPHDPAWAESFEAERGPLAQALGDLAAGPVEHMGSTAVPGLAAKPIIDMVVPLRRFASIPKELADALAPIGWVHAPEPDDEAMHRHSFCKPDPAWRTHHLHAIDVNRPRWRDWLAFRDNLRRHPEAAAAYAELKRELAARYADDRDAYRSGKDAFVAAALTEP